MKLAIVTGGSKGLGESIVEEYSKSDDWRVYELSRSGTSQQSLCCDLSSVDSVNDVCNLLFSEVSNENWDEVVFINNAGDVNPITLVNNLQPSDILRSTTINQVSAFILISTFISSFRLLNAPKTIVNISSGAAQKGYAGWSLYCASKAACDNFINAIAVEEGTQAYPFVAVNYDPNVMDTAMQATIRNADESDFPTLEKFIGYKEDATLLKPQYVATDLLTKIAKGMVNSNRYSVE